MNSRTHKKSPLIGIPCKKIPTPDIPPNFDGVRESYINAIVTAGGVPVLIPLVTDKEILRKIFDSIDGIFLAGGEDIDPAIYGEAAHKKTDKPSPERDAVEIQLVRWAYEENKPTLGVCRGCQVINVALGGSLFQDIPSESSLDLKYEHNFTGAASDWKRLAHKILVDDGSLLFKVLKTREPETNSLHHQAINNVADELKIVAISSDNIVEAIEASSNKRFFLGVQCHPEVLVDDTDLPWGDLFKAFVEEAARENS